jgi:hypothetical protein
MPECGPFGKRLSGRIVPAGCFSWAVVFPLSSFIVSRAVRPGGDKPGKDDEHPGMQDLFQTLAGDSEEQKNLLLAALPPTEQQVFRSHILTAVSIGLRNRINKFTR